MIPPFVSFKLINDCLAYSTSETNLDIFGYRFHSLGFREAVLLKALIPISSRVGPDIRYPIPAEY